MRYRVIAVKKTLSVSVQRQDSKQRVIILKEWYNSKHGISFWFDKWDRCPWCPSIPWCKRCEICDDILIWWLWLRVGFTDRLHSYSHLRSRKMSLERVVRIIVESLMSPQCWRYLRDHLIDRFVDFQATSAFLFFLFFFWRNR